MNDQAIIGLCPDGSFSVDSFTGAEKTYRVTLTPVSCTCPHFAARLAAAGGQCKHITAVQARLKKGRPEYGLITILDPPGDLVIIPADYRSLTGTQPIIGSSVKLSGPRTDEEMAENLRNR